MGLDMFLNKVKREEVAYWRKANAIHDWFSRLYAEKTGGEELDNCQKFTVSKEDLVKLKNACQKVIDSSRLAFKEVPVEKYDMDKMCFVTETRMMNVIDDSSVAEELLPTRSGFFFGSTTYGEYYLEDLEETIEQIDKILETVDFDEYSLEYYAWW